MKSRKQVLKKLFLSTLYLSAFTFGGGYVIVTQHSWLSLQEFADLVAIAAFFAVCLVLLRKTKLSPILVMLWPEPSICCCRHSRTDAPADVRHSSYMGFSPFSAADGAGADIR